MGSLEMKAVISFLTTGKTLLEIAEKFRISEEDAKRLVSAEVDGYNFFPSKNEWNETIYRLVPEQSIEIVKPKIWKYDIATGPSGRPQPYIQVIIPDNIPGKKIKLYPLGDIHYGSDGYDDEVFKAHLKLVEGKKHAFFVIIGDVTENALKDSPGTGVFTQKVRPSKQLAEVREILRPLAHKCLLAMPGNHEYRTLKHTDLEPLKLAVCNPLEIPYFGEPTHLDIFWRGNIFTFFLQHGRGGGATKGGKLNAASRPLAVNEHTMFTIMGHVHDPNSVKNIKRCLEFARDEEKKVRDMKTIHRVEHVVICPAMYHFYGTYASEAGYHPVAKDVSIACVLEESGKYFLDKKPLKY